MTVNMIILGRWLWIKDQLVFLLGNYLDWLLPNIQQLQHLIRLALILMVRVGLLFRVAQLTTDPGQVDRVRTHLKKVRSMVRDTGYVVIWPPQHWSKICRLTRIAWIPLKVKKLQDTTEWNKPGQYIYIYIYMYYIHIYILIYILYIHIYVNILRNFSS